MKRSFILLFGSVLTWFFLQVSSNAYSNDPEKFIGEIVAEAKLILNSDVTKDEKAKKLSEIALKTVDIKGIGYYTLGSKRKEISEEEKKNHSKYLKTNLKKNYFN